MLLPIRFIGAEVRRPEGVTLRKLVPERHPDQRMATRLFQEEKLSIGAEARKLAYASRTAAFQTLFSTSGHALPGQRVLDEAKSRTHLGAHGDIDDSVEGARDSVLLEEGAGADAVPYEVLQDAVTGRNTRPADGNRVQLPLIEPRVEEADAGATGPESSVPYEVLRRVVTDAAAEVVRGEIIFAPPENGGQPYGREVPFVDEEEGVVHARSTSSDGDERHPEPPPN